MPTTQVQRQTIYFESYGNGESGETALLMHGWTQTAADMRPLAPLLDGYHVLIPDLPGYGRSVPPFRTYPADFYLRDAQLMAGFLDALGLSNVHILGFSDGGEVALMLGVLRPDICRSIIAWGAIGAFGPEACAAAQRGLPPTWITDELRAQHPGQEVDRWPYQWVEAFCAMIAAGGDVSLSRAHEIACPLLLMLGDQDRLNPVAGGQHFIEQAARGRPGVPRHLETFTGAGHPIHEQQPEAFARAVNEFLRTVNAWYTGGTGA